MDAIINRLLDEGFTKEYVEGYAAGLAKGHGEVEIFFRAIMGQILIGEVGALPEAMTQALAAADLDTLTDGLAAVVFEKPLPEFYLRNVNSATP